VQEEKKVFKTLHTVALLKARQRKKKNAQKFGENFEP
jgi:hypothetical protein